MQWLLSPVMPGDPTPRWKVTGVLREEPAVAFVVPVRDMHVLYGLKREALSGLRPPPVAACAEYFVPMEALTAYDGDKNPDLRAMLARASATANFLNPP